MNQTYEILIIDGSSTVRMMIKKALETLDANIVEASDGKKGLEIAFSRPFDLFITDIDLPELDGIDLSRKLKKNKRTRTIPILIVSDLNSDNDMSRGFDAGASGYLSKKEIHTHLRKLVQETITNSIFRHARTIEVVDDSKSIRHIVGNGLLQMGFEVLTAENGRLGLELARDAHPDLILSDINMPEMNGFEFCKAINSDEHLSNIPFVVMSTNQDRSHMKRIMQDGAAAYIVKPFILDQLVILIEKILSDHFMLLHKEREKYESERQQTIASITGLVTALEARDAYTRGHSEDVARMVVGMVKLTGASDSDIDRAMVGGRLHDIGKIGIRDNVLLKPGKLTREEFNHIKKHPEIGAKIINTIPGLSDIIPIVLSHHERVDGKGYPHGLKGIQIPEWARVTAVADTFHALTSDRPYRKGMPMEKALQIIDENIGTQLCQDCVKLFYQWLDNDS
ncbi:response regulator receiver modulated metal dependent phosphohydrolase [Candidatus Magnetomorum sp. HK-1]|nr:response regulator receiver modulated metal dependent phosphohydrolase [Candidatus Magnetomorum sp. HK-1]